MRENYLTVIPVAGKGVRAMCLTGYGAIIKPFINATERGATVMEEIIKEANLSGLYEFNLIVSGREDEETFKKFFRPFEFDSELEENLVSRGNYDDLEVIRKLSLLNVEFYIQSIPKGFGDAIAMVYPKLMNDKNKGKPYHGVVVILGDDIIYSETPCCKQLISVHKKTGGMVVGVQEVSYEEAKKFGVVLIDYEFKSSELPDDFSGKKMYKVSDIEEKPDEPKPNIIDGKSKYYAILGRYVLNDTDVGFLYGDKMSSGKELDFSYLFMKNINEGHLYAVEIEGDWHTVGSPIAAQKTAIKYALSQFGKNGKLGNEGKDLALFAFEVMKEKGIILETGPNIFTLCDELKNELESKVTFGER